MNGLCECGCGQNTRIAPRTKRTDGWIKGQPIRFVRGHQRRGKPGTRRGAKLSAETRAKITGRPVSDSTKREALHQWLVKHHPKAGHCEECGREGKTDYAFKHHPAPHTRDIADYRELCRSCHFKLDEPWKQRGPELQKHQTTEQRRAAGLRGAEARWGRLYR